MPEESEYTKHTVSNDALDTLGTIIDAYQERDAIHLAVFPVQAGEAKLRPGDHCYIGSNGKAFYAETSALGMGIVDPFIEQKRINEDDWFWLVVYPRQITSLHHVWEHPKFPDNVKFPNSQERSEKFIRNYCSGGGYDVPSFDTLIESTKYHIANRWNDEYLTINGEDASGTVPSDLWDHLLNYLGVRDAVKKPDYFSCSC